MRSHMVNVFSPEIASDTPQLTHSVSCSSGCSLETTEGAVPLPLHILYAHRTPINIAQSSQYRERRAIFLCLLGSQQLFSPRHLTTLSPLEGDILHSNKKAAGSPVYCRESLCAEPRDLWIWQGTSCLEPPQGCRLWEENSHWPCVHLIGCMTVMPSS